MVRIGGAASSNKRLMEMGITRGTMVFLVRGYSLSLRKAEARAIEVERLAGASVPHGGRTTENRGT